MKAAVRAVAILLCLAGASRIRADCSVTATGVNFGAYDVFSPVPRDSTGTVTVACDSVPPPDPVISIGASGTTGAFLPRKMRQATGAGMLEYNLFTDSSMTVVWGDGTAGTATVNLKNVQRRRPPVVVTIYGRISPGQNAPSGTYSDTLTVTIVW